MPIYLDTAIKLPYGLEVLSFLVINIGIDVTSSPNQWESCCYTFLYYSTM